MGGGLPQGREGPSIALGSTVVSEEDTTKKRSLEVQENSSGFPARIVTPNSSFVYV